MTDAKLAAVKPAAWRAAPDSPPRLRRARAGDRLALTDMLVRCSDETRLRRFHGIARAFPEPYLTEAVTGTAGHFAVVAETPGAVAGLASCRAVASDVADLAVLVEDARQRQGIGRRMLSMLLAHAARSDIRTLRATVLADQEWIVRALRRHGACRARASAGVLEVTLALESGRDRRWPAAPPCARHPVSGRDGSERQAPMSPSAQEPSSR